MFNKTFDQMRELDVTDYCDFREAKDENGNKIKVPYLNWAKCVDLLHQNGAERVYYTPLVNENGSSLFMSEFAFEDKNGNVNRCYEVRVHCVIDNLEFDMSAPLLNGSLVVHDKTLNQLRVANAQARAFVKGVAIHTGLGFGLWSKYEAKEEEDNQTERYVRIDDLTDIKVQLQELYTTKIKNGLSTQDIASALGVTHDTVKAYFSYFDVLLKFYKDLRAL